MGILERIQKPEDLDGLTFAELDELSGEIRTRIIEVVSRNGGHLASNLGVVDLTLALHRVFRSPKDKIIWDVGHQCYTHKILTGRNGRMDTIRKKGGLVGYPDRQESEHDVLNTGHASTSLAFASGMALARDHRKEPHHVVAVIGDGALTGGLALEALNHIGQIRQPLIVVLNDNKMSISPNVGAISRHLNYLVAGRPYNRLKEVVQGVLSSIPGIGKTMVESARKLETLARTMMVPGSLFDELGVKYVGPVNGHNIKEMMREMEEAKKSDIPVLLHVVTQKGSGYAPAQENPSDFHSSSPFEIEDGKFIKSEQGPSYSKVFGQTLVRLAEVEEDVVGITAAMPGGTGLDLMQQRFPDRFYDVGIAEGYMLDFAGGLALGGMKPVMSIYATFLQRAVDQVMHDFSLMSIPALVGVDRAGLVGGDGPTHQGIFDLALLRPVPGIVVMVPRDENELQHMMFSGLQMKQPVFIRFPKEGGQGVPMDERFLPLPPGRCEVMREGRDGLVLALGPLVHRALRIAETMAEEERVQLTVVNLRFFKPLDEETLKPLLAHHRRIVTIEDGILGGGLSDQIRELLGRCGNRRAELLCMGVNEGVVPVASRKELLARYGLDDEGMGLRFRSFFRPMGLLRRLAGRNGHSGLIRPFA